MNRIDLHVHSNKSDGTLSPTELVSYALEKHLSAFALTDHDTIDGLNEALDAAKNKPIEVIPGIEFSTEYNGKDIHILGLYIDYDDNKFLSYLKSFKESRSIRNQKMCAKLMEYGISISYDALQSEYPNSILTRAHFAKYLLKQGYVKSMKEAFDRYIGDYAPCFLPREKVTPAQAIQIILEAGGIPILAHPILYHFSDRNLDILVALLKEQGLVGIETIYSTYATSEERMIRHLAKKYKLLMTGGSDFHGATKPNIDLGLGYGKLFVPDELLENIKLYRKENGMYKDKIIFTDMDGTLLNDDKKISTSIREQIIRFTSQGGHLVLSSGRPLESILKTRDELNLCLPNMYVIAYNGALIYDCDANLPLSEFCVSFEEIKQLLALANTHNLHIHTYSDGQIITPQENEELQFYTKHIHMPYQVVPDLVSHLSKPPYKMIAIHLNEKANPKLDDFGKVVTQITDGNIHTFRSSEQYLECCHKQASKGNAITFLCHYLNIPINTAVAIGDAGNDIPMLTAAGISICMKNGTPDAKYAAEFETKQDNNHDGFLDAFQYI